MLVLAAIVLILSLFHLLRQNDYDVNDTFEYVSSTVKQGWNKDAGAVQPAVYTSSTNPTPITISVTVTQTETAPTVTETTEVEKEVEKWNDAPSKFDMSGATNISITLPKTPFLFDPKGPKSSDIIFLTAANGGGHNADIDNILELAAGNRKAYCDYHGYIYHFINIDKYDLGDSSAVWKKIPAIVEAFNEYPEAQWLFMLDLDAIIMTPEQDLQSLILSQEGMEKHLHLGAELLEGGQGNFFPQEPDFDVIDFIIAQDHNGVNAGSFFLRRTQFTQLMVDMWLDPFYMNAPWERSEQDAILHLLKHHRVVREHTGIAKQRTINAYTEPAEGASWQKWHEGDLLIHIAGCWVYGACAEWWQDAWDKRTQLPKRSTANSESFMASAADLMAILKRGDADN